MFALNDNRKAQLLARIAQNEERLALFQQHPDPFSDAIEALSTACDVLGAIPNGLTHAVGMAYTIDSAQSTLAAARRALRNNNPQPHIPELLAQLRTDFEVLDNLPDAQSVDKNDVLRGLMQVPGVQLDSVEVTDEYVSWVFDSIVATVTGTGDHITPTLAIPRTHIALHRNMRITITDTADGDDSVFRYSGYSPSVHPHVLGEAPCFGDFQGAITDAIAQLDFTALALLIKQFLEVVNARDDAGRDWARPFVLDLLEGHYDDEEQLVLTYHEEYSQEDNEYVLDCVVREKSYDEECSDYTSVLVGTIRLRESDPVWRKVC